ncbi:MAG TPA: GDP-fucose synthetase, partial [Streptomyces sp.]|nr:GDP-fucose synthetase [Streptomyces sp.]
MTTELPEESRALGRPLLSPGARVFVAGHRGLVGSALARRLTADGHEVVTRGRDELDLRDAAATGRYLRDVRPDAVVLAAAKVGGIMANSTWPVQFLEDNLRIQLSVIAGAHAAGTPRLLFLGSSCIYPKHAPQPIREDSLLTGPLEPTNEAYALAKIAGVVQTRSYRRQYGASYISAMPTNLYGPGDNFDLETSHVLPALIRRFHEAKRERAPEVTLWGTGGPRREFLHVDDLAAAC